MLVIWKHYWYRIETALESNRELTKIHISSSPRQRILHRPLRHEMPKILPNNTQVLPAQAQILPSQAQILPRQAEVLPRQAKVLPGQAKVLPGQAKILSA